MIEITHPKVASLTPEWAPFGGCTIIFERFGRAGGGPGDATALHGALADALAGVVPADWRALAFCPLPIDSLHLTVADLLHQGNLKAMPEGVRSELSDAAGRIVPLRALTAIGEPLDESGILDVDTTALTFVFSKVAVRNRRVIVAELEPDAASASQAAFARLLAARDRLGASLLARFGVATEEYAPHVTLGYLANRDLARRAEPLAAEIDALVDPKVRGRSFNYGRPGLYTFSDMARFDQADG